MRKVILMLGIFLLAPGCEQNDSDVEEIITLRVEHDDLLRRLEQLEIEVRKNLLSKEEQAAPKTIEIEGDDWLLKKCVDGDDPHNRIDLRELQPLANAYGWKVMTLRKIYFEATAMEENCEAVLRNFLARDITSRRGDYPTVSSMGDVEAKRAVLERLLQIETASFNALEDVVFYPEEYPPDSETPFFCTGLAEHSGCHFGDRIEMANQLLYNLSSNGLIDLLPVNANLTAESIGRQKIKGIREFVDVWQKMPDEYKKEDFRRRVCRQEKDSLNHEQLALLMCDDPLSTSLNPHTARRSTAPTSRSGVFEKTLILSVVFLLFTDSLDTHTPYGYNKTHMKHSTNKTLVRRLRIMEGQIRGLERMVSQNAYCVDVIVQSSAIKKALASFEEALLENHLSTCVVKQMKSGEHTKAIKEVMKVYKLSKKNE